MCGIFGCILNEGQVAPLIHAALKRLEYRGYDSVGVLTVSDGKLHIKKDRGKIDEVHEMSYDKKVSEMKILELGEKDKKIVKKCKEFVSDLISEEKDQKERWLHLACVIHFLNKYHHEHLKDVESFGKIFSKFEPDKYKLKEIERAWKLLKKHKLSPSNVETHMR